MSAPDRIEAAWLRRPATQAVFAALEAAGFEGRVVGGAVRNTLLGKSVTDIDIATPALPEEVVAAAVVAGLAVVPTGLRHGTVTVISDSVPHEVTTLRHDVETDGRHAVVAFSADWAQDAARRDFTINALYCDRYGAVYDPLDGLADLAARKVRFIGDPHERIREDYLRILRFFRFSAEYAAGPFDPHGLAAAGELRAGLLHLSRERVRAELVKLLVAPRAGDAIETMSAFGFLSPLLGLVTSPGLLAKAIAMDDAFGEKKNPMLRLGLLAVSVREHAVWLAKHLRLSAAEKGDLLAIAEGHLGVGVVTEVEARRAIYQTGQQHFRLKMLASAIRAAEPVTSGILALLRGVYDWEPPTLPVSGRDLLPLGYEAGPRIGQALRTIEADWVASDFTASKNELLRSLAGHGGDRG